MFKIVLVIIAFPLAFFLGYLFYTKSSSPLPNLLVVQKEKILAEIIPGSKFHSPDATWWGYNQSKIVRHKDKVFTYYIENADDSNRTASNFVILKKDGESPWEEGAMFPTSRPGNLLIDSKGVLHAFVFEPFDVVKNDSWGKIIHYFFPDSSSGDIKNYQQEIVVDNDGKGETANIRVGAAIGSDDTMAISFGLTKFNPLYKEKSEHIYYKRSLPSEDGKKPGEKSWNHTFIDGLPHDYYYPFTLVSGNSFYLLPIQDDFTGQNNPNIYQKILFMEVSGGVWKSNMIVDLSSHPLAKHKPRLLEQEDLYQDKDGNIHIIYKEFLDPNNTFAATVHWHVKGRPGDWKSERINLEKKGANWVRLVEVDGKLYYLITTYGELFTSPVENVKLTKLNIPDVKNNYPYVSTTKGGSSESNFIDVLLLGADQKLFQEGQITNYYVRIPKSEFTNLK